MESCLMQPDTAEKHVGMGQIVAAPSPARLRAVLGSCVGVAIHCPRRRLGVLAHVVLPDSSGRSDSPGKYANTAVPEMLRALTRAGAPTSGLAAKLAGGASMFGHEGPLQIGDANVQAVVEALQKAGGRVAARDVGGRVGRRVTLDCETGQFTIEIVGQPPRVL